MTQRLAEELAEFARIAGRSHLTPIIGRLRRPAQVAVVGRCGVGRRTVAAALRGHGVAVVSDAATEASDVRVVVIAEAVKPEDVVMLRATGQPTLIVLTKADLAGSDPGGPMVVARRRAAAIRSSTGMSTVPVVGLLAALGPDALTGDLLDALRSFVTEPADLTSVDAFLDGTHRIGRDVRAHLLRRLDRFGIAHAVLALAGGTDPTELAAQLRRLGNLDEALTALAAAEVSVRYRRICAALTELRCLAVQLDDDGLAALATSDATVMAAMTAAVEVVEAAGLTVDRRDTRAAHLGRAMRWDRYGRGPVDALHGRCSADIVRGSLRLLAACASGSA